MSSTRGEDKSDTHNDNEEDDDEENEWNEEEEEDEENDGSSSSDWEDGEEEDDDEEDEEALLRGRSLLWLCQEGQIQLARRRFDRLLRMEKDQQKQQQQQEQEPESSSSSLLRLKREVFQMARSGDKNYPLHEILMGGTSDRNAYQLTKQLLDFCQENHPLEYSNMLVVQPPSHKRTPLHWACWGNAPMDIVRPLIFGNPEALVLKDTAGRTPSEIFKYYFCSNRQGNNNNNTSDNNSEGNQQRLEFLERMTKSWTQQRLRMIIHKCAIHYFVTKGLTPFDKVQRRNDTNMTPKSWYILSILGTLLQREMKPLLRRILDYIGGNAKIAKAAARKSTQTKNNNSNNNKNKKRSRKTTTAPTNNDDAAELPAAKSRRKRR